MPTTEALAQPMNTAAIAEDRFSGGTNRATVAAACGVYRAEATPHSARMKVMASRPSTCVASACIAAQHNITAVNSARRSKRAVSPARKGALKHTASAKAGISCAVRVSGAFRPSASAGSMPLTISAPVPIMKLPEARARMTGFKRTQPAGEAAARRLRASAMRSAASMLEGSAMPCPAMSKAVP